MRVPGSGTVHHSTRDYGVVVEAGTYRRTGPDNQGPSSTASTSYRDGDPIATLRRVSSGRRVVINHTDGHVYSSHENGSDSSPLNRYVYTDGRGRVVPERVAFGDHRSTSH